MLIDITKFLIISQNQFDVIINSLNCNLTIADPCYLVSYLFVNFMAYVIIYLVIKIVMFCYYQIFSNNKRGRFF